jgi:hemerythrin-like domain-containing protein
MPVSIGGKQESGFGDPLGLLWDCHRRIERFLEVLIKVSEQARGGPLTAEQRSALDDALRYFREAAPHHTADEEETLFPRLRKRDEPEVKAVLSRVDALQQDHAQANRRHRDVELLGQSWLVCGSLTAADAARFSEMLHELAILYRDHIAVEERELFPVAAKVLAEEDRRAIGGEMAARRGLRAGFGHLFAAK